jgi:hypothetical protein
LAAGIVAFVLYRIPINNLARSTNRGLLTVENGTGSAAQAKLIDLRTNRLKRSFPVPAKRSTREAVPDGIYRLIFALDDGLHGYYAFHDRLHFETRRHGGLVRFTKTRVTLHKVYQGSAPTSPIAAQEFNRY